jgi:transcription initiation factor TFIID subunit 2
VSHHGNYQNDQKCKFTYVDPASKLAKEDSIKSFEHISGCYETALTASDPEKGNGELSIEFPEEIKSLINVPDPPTLSITVEYTLEKPRGGIQFIPGVSAHCFTMGESRLWFSCVDTNTELCTWTLEITVDTKLTVVACGELVDTVLHSDKKTKTFNYKLSIPTSAPNIGLAIGPFEIHVDRAMPEMTHFCLPGLLKELKITTSTGQSKKKKK